MSQWIVCLYSWWQGRIAPRRRRGPGWAGLQRVVDDPGGHQKCSGERWSHHQCPQWRHNVPTLPNGTGSKHNGEAERGADESGRIDRNGRAGIPAGSGRLGSLLFPAISLGWSQDAGAVCLSCGLKDPQVHLLEGPGVHLFGLQNERGRIGR